MKSFMICTFCQILFQLSNQEELDGRVMGHIGREETCRESFHGEK